MDTTSFGETYGIFSLEVQERTEGEWEDGERKREDPVFRKENGMLISSLKIPDFETAGQAVSERKLETCSPLLPVPYAGAVQLSTKGMDHGMENSGGK